MPISDLDIYDTGHPICQVITRALQQGSGGRIVPVSEGLQDGPAAVYGILRGCDRIIDECEWIGRDFYHVDHGYVRRGHYHGYYRISRNGLQWSGAVGDYPADRWRSLGVDLQPWRRTGRTVVVCPIARAIGAFYGIDPHLWLAAVTRELARHTDRPVVVKPKDSEEDLSTVLKDAWCLVAYNSNAAVEAVIQGVPVIVLGPSAAEPVARHRLCDVERPIYPDREPWLHALAYQQWQLTEIRRGECWDVLERFRT